MFECLPDTPSEKIPKGYFELLKANREYLEEITGDNSIEMAGSRGGGTSNEAQILKTIKAVVGKFKGYTDDDEEFLKLVKAALENGTIPRNTSKRIKQLLTKNLNPLGVLQSLRNNISYDDLFVENQQPKERLVREVILSELILGTRT